MKHKFYFILFWGALLLLEACHSTRAGSTRVSKEKLNLPLKLDAVALQDSLQKASLSYRTLLIKGRGDYANKNQKQSFGYRLQMQKDSAISLSISVLGIQALRLIMDNDSVRWINYLDKSYTVLSLATFMKRYNIQTTLGQLQGLLLGEFPLSGDSLRVVGWDNSIRIVKIQPNQPVLEFYVNSSNFKLKSFSANADTLKVEAMFDNYHTLGKVPSALVIAIKGKQAVYIQLQHNSLEVNPAKLNFNFSAPNNYVRK
jgi:hypothetical protein